MAQGLEIGDSSEQFHPSGNRSLVEIRSLVVTGSHTPTARNSAQDMSLAPQTHASLVIHDSDFHDWKMDLLLRVDEMYKLEMSYCLNGISQAIRVWELLHKSPKTNTMVVKYNFKYFTYDILLNFNLVIDMINSAIILLHRRDSGPIFNQQNYDAFSSKNNEGGMYSENIKLQEMQQERVENELTRDDLTTPTLVNHSHTDKCEKKNRKYGTLRRSFTTQNLHSANEESPFHNQFQIPLRGEGKKVSTEMAPREIEHRENVQHNAISPRGNHYSSHRATEGDGSSGDECPKKYLAEFRVRNIQILTGKSVDNSSNRCICEVATPLKFVHLRLHTIQEDGFF